MRLGLAQVVRSLACAAFVCALAAGCSDLVRDGQYACRSPGSRAECPPEHVCGLGFASSTELRCYRPSSLRLDAGDEDLGLDSGTDAQRDAGPPRVLTCESNPTCETPCVIDGVLGSTLEVELTTTASDPRGPLELTCPLASGPGSGPPQAVVAVRVPGVGPVSVTLDTEDPRTEIADTIVEARPTCDAIEGAECFDDINNSEGRTQTRGTVVAEGGTTLYVVVTSFRGGVPDRGRVHLAVTLIDVGAPLLSFLSLSARHRSDAELLLTGRFTFADEEAQIDHLRLRFGGDDGPVDYDGDGRVDAADDVTMPTIFDGAIRGTEVALDPISVRRLDLLGVTTVDATIVDRDGNIGNTLTRPIAYGATEGEACTPPFVCDPTFSCEPDTCRVSAATRAACAAAEIVSIPAPGMAPTAVTRSGTIGGAGPNDFVAVGCSYGTTGPEDVYLVPIAPGASVDLIARTDLPGTSVWVSTVVYVRRMCESPSSEVTCSDSFDPVERRSRAVVQNASAGTHAVIVERFTSVPQMSAPYEIELSLRPVLTSGNACDETGERNRCASNMCVDGVCL